jgi:hypothetical protein
MKHCVETLLVRFSHMLGGYTRVSTVNAFSFGQDMMPP